MSETGIPSFRKSYLFKMATQIAMQQGQKILNQNPELKFQMLLKQADTLVRHVGRLKGAAMKVIQSLSIEGQDFIPPEVIQVLEQLQSKAPPVDNKLLLDLARKELGEEKFSQLKDISEAPIASASIGQVYRATYQGQSVIIKIQYPGVAESVDEDVETLKKLLNGLLFMTQKKINMNDLIDEMKRVLKQETDYKKELESLQAYRELFSEGSYIVPKAFPELTTSKVIVMSFEEGVEFSSWLKGNPDPALKDQVAQQILELYNKEFFENQLVQTDPNPANFLVREDGRLVLLDFGATLRFSTDFVEKYQKLMRTVFSEDHSDILEKVYDLNFLDPRESKEVQQNFIDFLLFSLRPFQKDVQPFDFADSEYSQEVRNRALSFTRQLKYSAPPKDLIFLHRKLGGVFMLLKKMEVKSDLTDYRDRLFENDYWKTA